MIRSLLYLTARDDDYEAVVGHFRATGILERASQHRGCLGAEMEVPLTGGGPLVVTALWTSASDYESWRDDPWRLSSSAALETLLQRSPEEVSPSGTLYQIVHSVTRDDGMAASRRAQ